MLRCCVYEIVVSVHGNDQHKCFLICVGNCCKIRCVVLCFLVLCVVFCCVVCCVLLCRVVLCFVLCCMLFCYFALLCVVFCCVLRSVVLCFSVVYCCLAFPYQFLILCRSKLRFILSSTLGFVSVLWDQILIRMDFLVCHKKICTIMPAF